MNGPSMTLSNDAMTKWFAGRQSEARALRTLFFTLAWVFIFFAATYDTYFAWQYRTVLAYWEMNPFIVWLAGVGGLASVFILKIFTMIFSTGMAIYCHRQRHRWEIPFTLVVGGIYFALSIQYVMMQKCA
jgi:hypothetical protein